MLRLAALELRREAGFEDRQRDDVLIAMDHDETKLALRVMSEFVKYHQIIPAARPAQREATGGRQNEIVVEPQSFLELAANFCSERNGSRSHQSLRLEF